MEPEADPTSESIPTFDHPALGRAVAVLDDRRRTLRTLGAGVFWVAVGLLGVAMGVGDTTGGDNVGIPFGIFGALVTLFGVNEVRVNLLRLTTPVRMIVGERGFAVAGGPGPILWASVEEVDLAYGRRDPRANAIRVRLRADDGGEGRWISVGAGTTAPPEDVAAFMRDRLASVRSRKPVAPESRAHPARTSRH
jgi:hypothetical protein